MIGRVVCGKIVKCICVCVSQHASPGAVRSFLTGWDLVGASLLSDPVPDCISCRFSECWIRRVVCDEQSCACRRHPQWEPDQGSQNPCLCHLPHCGSEQLAAAHGSRIWGQGLGWECSQTLQVAGVIKRGQFRETQIPGIVILNICFFRSPMVP